MSFPSPPLRIEPLPAEASADTQLMRSITDLVNRVYAEAEDGQWLPGTTRTDIEEITEFTRAGQLVVAWLDDAVVGSIRVQYFDARTAETGMLVADPEHRGKGIGRELRRFVIDVLKDQGIETLQIELLVPREWKQPSKDFMAGWNERSGYRVVRRGAFEDQYPHLAPRLATPCDFIIYHKSLVGPGAI